MQGDAGVVRLQQGGAMRDGDEGDAGAFPAQQGIEHALRRGIEAGGRFVEEDPRRARHQDPCEGKALLFPR